MLYPFVNKPCSEDAIKETRVYKLLELLKEKGSYRKLSDQEKEDINNLFSELFNPDRYKYGFIRLQGWIIDFRPFMKTYLVNFKYYGWQEIKAFNKTCIRKNASFPSYILEIIEKK